MSAELSALAAAGARLADSAPPLSRAQIDRIVAVLRPSVAVAS